MKLENYHPTPKIQYPLRLEYELHDRFSHISNKTKIPMSTLGRLGITKLINDIELKGITTVLEEMEDQ
jgi:predicted DNA-binding protein